MEMKAQGFKNTPSHRAVSSRDWTRDSWKLAHRPPIYQVFHIKPGLLNTSVLRAMGHFHRILVSAILFLSSAIFQVGNSWEGNLALQRWWWQWWLWYYIIILHKEYENGPVKSSFLPSQGLTKHTKSPFPSQKLKFSKLLAPKYRELFLARLGLHPGPSLVPSASTYIGKRAKTNPSLSSGNMSTRQCEQVKEPHPVLTETKGRRRKRRKQLRRK